MNFRLIEESNTHRITYDDGPGSLSYPDVVKSEIRILEEWFGDESDKDEIVAEIRKYLNHHLSSIYADLGGYYYIEYRENGCSEWQVLS